MIEALFLCGKLRTHVAEWAGFWYDGKCLKEAIWIIKTKTHG